MPAAITPPPPVAEGVGLPWDVEVADPVTAIATARARHGDTFVIDSGTDRYLFTFSAVGVESFYALPEERASKGLADFRMLSRKLPDAIFSGRRVLPFELFRRDDVAVYLANLDRAIAATVVELGGSSANGTVDVFGLTRRVAHRMGLASWGGPGCDRGAAFEDLVAAFDALDGADAFVHPDAMAAVAASGKEAEIAALDRIVEIIGAGVTELDGHEAEHGLFARIVAAWQDVPADERRTGVACDVALIHVASMSNLAAALGWVLVDLLEHPEEAERVAAGDGARTEQCALESIRLAQRSIMSRYVLDEIHFDVGGVAYTVPPGVTIATLLPLTNAEVPGYDQWLPDRWNRHRLADPSQLASPQLVTAFGHGKHSCPAQPFSLAAATAAATQLLRAFDITAAWTDRPQPVPAQIGGVARADRPCPVTYRGK